MKISVTKAREQLLELIRRAEVGEEIILTLHGQAVAHLVPTKMSFDQDARRKLLQTVRASDASKATAGPDAARSHDLDEAEAKSLSKILEAGKTVLISTVTLAEALIVAQRRNVGEEMSRLIEEPRFDVLNVTPAAARGIAETYARWGMGSHPAGLISAIASPTKPPRSIPVRCCLSARILRGRLWKGSIVGAVLLPLDGQLV